MSHPQPHSSGVADRTQTPFSNPPHPITPHHLPRDKSSPSNPVFQEHALHFSGSLTQVLPFTIRLRGVVLFMHMPRRLSPGEMCQPAIPGLDRFSQNRYEWTRKVQVLAQLPHPRCPSSDSRAICGYKSKRSESPQPSSPVMQKELLLNKNLLPMSLQHPNYSIALKGHGQFSQIKIWINVWLVV